MGESRGSHAVMEEFAARRRRQWVATLCVMPVVLALFYLTERGRRGGAGLDEILCAVAAGVLVLGLLVFSLWNWRCPACRAYLGRGFAPRFCGRCGERLQV